MTRLIDIVFKFTQEDFWHTKRIIGNNIEPDQLSGYYLDLSNKTYNIYGLPSRDKVPLVKYKNNYFLHPITVCQIALGWHERWLYDKSSICLDNFLYYSNWLLDNQEELDYGGGVWTVPFDVPIYKLSKGWISSLVQGQALSVLSRAYMINKNSGNHSAQRNKHGHIRFTIKCLT